VKETANAPGWGFSGLVLDAAIFLELPTANCARGHFRAVSLKREDCLVDLVNGSREDEEPAGRRQAFQDCPRFGGWAVTEEVWGCLPNIDARAGVFP